MRVEITAFERLRRKNKINAKDYTLNQLRARAVEKGIKGANVMKKAELLKILGE